MASETPRCFAAVLLDLDGTLVDTAPDMVRALHELCDEQGVTRVDFARARAQVSNGVTALLELAFGAHERDNEALRARYLQRYALGLARDSHLFPGVEEVLAEMDLASLPWGVVTNKPSAYTMPLLTALGLDTRAACVVSGDTTARAKPHPQPLLHASAGLGLEPEMCLYVGDAERDVQAGRAAGMFTVAAAYGYLHHPDDARRWCADAVIGHPRELRRWLPAARAAG